MICPINESGYCARHKTHHTKVGDADFRAIALNDGEVGVRHREAWDVIYGVHAPLSFPENVKNPRTIKSIVGCPHVGEELRSEDGKAKTRYCGPCQKDLKLFACNNPSRPMGDEVTVQDCLASCPEHPSKKVALPIAPLAPSSPCDCSTPGFCQRYGKEMRGRLWEICRGVNVDAGEAASLRLQWAQEKPEVIPVAIEPPVASPGIPVKKARAIILKNHLSPGDVLVMSAAIYSLHRTHPGKFLTAIDTTANALYEHNLDVATVQEVRDAGGEEVQTHYPAIARSNERGITFMQGYCEFFAEALGVPVPLATNRPHVYLSQDEKKWLDQVHEATGRKRPFWLINSGVKKDFTCKGWGHVSYQKVVDILRGKILFVQVGSKEHLHRPLDGVLDFIGKTDLRQLVRLTHHCDGVLCGVTLLQHLAASLEKPSVVIMGGREPVAWNTYPKQQLLHTIGALDCCKNSGCWQSRVVPLGDGEDHDQKLCSQPTFGTDPVPRCMTIISPEEVAEKILRVCT